MNADKRYIGAIALIKSQTNYTEKEAKEKLEKWEGKYMNVIKEYLNPNFNKKRKENKKSNNEKMMYEIRNFMDTANTGYLKRKEEEEKKTEYLKNIYEKFLEVKKQYPTCKYNPPGVLTCDNNCPNHLCPGELLKNGKYSKMISNEPVNTVINL
tara:strand:- start:786 stop:1247 length:462 start_codon:yes stop_codon:yes gene_type:complete